MANSPAGPTLTCSQCNFANEAERVYCHNCGAKLDRSLLPKPEETDKDSIEKTRKRVKKMTNPGGPDVLREIKTLANVIIWSALVALILGLVREPDGVPPAKPKEGELPRMIGTELADAAIAQEPRVLQITEEEANAYLRTTLKSKGSALIPGAQFERAYVHFETGVVYVGLEQSIFGLPIHSGARYNVGVKNGQFYADNKGGNIGRVGIDPALMKYAVPAFQPLWTALKREKEQVQGMERIAMDHGRIGFVTKVRAK